MVRTEQIFLINCVRVRYKGCFHDPLEGRQRLSKGLTLQIKSKLLFLSVGVVVLEALPALPVVLVKVLLRIVAQTEHIVTLKHERHSVRHLEGRHLRMRVLLESRRVRAVGRHVAMQRGASRDEANHCTLA